MKRIFAVGLLMLWFASAALADGGGPKPNVTKPPHTSTVIVADGGGPKPPSASFPV